MGWLLGGSKESCETVWEAVGGETGLFRVNTNAARDRSLRFRGFGE